MSNFAPITSAAATAYNTADRAPRAVQAPSPAAARGEDQVEISSAARILGQLDQGTGIREDLVARIRAEIDAGTYETSDKLDATVNGLAGELG